MNKNSRGIIVIRVEFLIKGIVVAEDK